MNSIKLAIIEDDATIQESLCEFFGSQSNVTVSMAFYSVEDFLEAVVDLAEMPTILLLDINLPGISGVDGIPLIKKACPDLDIIMLTTFEETDIIFKALTNGACSYIAKRVPLKKIGEAVQIVSEGGSYMSPSIARNLVNYYIPKKTNERLLSDRQMDVVNGIVSGKSYKMIADELFVSLDTVRSHIKNIYKILEINSKAELIRKSFDNQL
ncbi:response regulator [Ulvibacter litoralis]|uniref:DNA-binding response regulator, NarL/FixJ family, contains REC and HTH domains n=1 Tax=Ulvibacter litoralis TaxID=227084 RepID=A0A1G7FWI8_9FLAO|nr:response regulator transcription factor [Ulvibacter litoralis]GHC64438.1 transcriptional regulatory protein DegU [Ulvibacter litoralis]SDE80284.1 DNA-binding response regulator, NarL/FixJ family, contains REC and HTH domains [Ulvibacter litoralis]